MPDRTHSAAAADLSAEAVGSASFPTGFRGFDQRQVRQFLAGVGRRLGELEAQVAGLSAELDLARTDAVDLAKLSEGQLSAKVGAETARVLGAARDSATQIKAKAEEHVAVLVRQAQDEAGRIRGEATGELDRHRTAAEQTAKDIRDMAHREGSAVRQAAHADADTTRAKAADEAAVTRADAEADAASAAEEAAIIRRRAEATRADAEAFAAATRAEADALAERIESDTEAHIAKIRAELDDELAALRAAAEADAAAMRAQAEMVVAKRLGDTEAAMAIMQAETDAETLARRDRADRQARQVVLAAEAEAERLVAGGRQFAADEREEARRESRQLVEEARLVRERMLFDLANRRRLAKVQLEQLRAGRERLLAAYDVVRRTLDEATGELGGVLVEAKLAADAAMRRAEADPADTVERLEAELGAARLAGLPLVTLPPDDGTWAVEGWPLVRADPHAGSGPVEHSERAADADAGEERHPIDQTGWWHSPPDPAEDHSLGESETGSAEPPPPGVTDADADSPEPALTEVALDAADVPGLAVAPADEPDADAGDEGTAADAGVTVSSQDDPSPLDLRLAGAGEPDAGDEAGPVLAVPDDVPASAVEPAAAGDGFDDQAEPDGARSTPGLAVVSRTDHADPPAPAPASGEPVPGGGWRLGAKKRRRKERLGHLPAPAGASAESADDDDEFEGIRIIGPVPPAGTRPVLELAPDDTPVFFDWRTLETDSPVEAAPPAADEQSGSVEPGLPAALDLRGDSPAGDLSDPSFTAAEPGVPAGVELRGGGLVGDVSDPSFTAGEPGVPAAAELRGERPVEDVSDPSFAAGEPGVPAGVELRGESRVGDVSDPSFTAAEPGVPGGVELRGERPVGDVSDPSFTAAEPGVPAGVDLRGKRSAVERPAPPFAGPETVVVGPDALEERAPAAADAGPIATENVAEHRSAPVRLDPPPGAGVEEVSQAQDVEAAQSADAGGGPPVAVEAAGPGPAGLADAGSPEVVGAESAPSDERYGSRSSVPADLPGDLASARSRAGVEPAGVEPADPGPAEPGDAAPADDVDSGSSPGAGSTEPGPAVATEREEPDDARTGPPAGTEPRKGRSGGPTGAGAGGGSAPAKAVPSRPVVRSDRAGGPGVVAVPPPGRSARPRRENAFPAAQWHNDPMPPAEDRSGMRAGRSPRSVPPATGDGFGAPVVPAPPGAAEEGVEGSGLDLADGSPAGSGSVPSGDESRTPAESQVAFEPTSTTAETDDLAETGSPATVSPRSVRAAVEQVAPAVSTSGASSAEPTLFEGADAGEYEPTGESIDIDALFARLRQGRAEEVSKARDVLGASAGSAAVPPAPNPPAAKGKGRRSSRSGPPGSSPSTGAGERGGATVIDLRDAARSGAGKAATPGASGDTRGHDPGQAVLDDDTLLERRDAVVERAEAQLARRLKRALSDEQNEVLDNLRRHGGTSLDLLLPPLSEQSARYTETARQELEEAAQAGRAFYGHGAGPAVDVGPIGRQLGREVVEALRDRLERSLQDGAGDFEATADGFRATYREWKARRLGDAARYGVFSAFNAGVSAGARDQPVRWLADTGGAPCPDAEDNALAGSVPCGRPFPTGDDRPPAHPECRCLLVPLHDPN